MIMEKLFLLTFFKSEKTERSEAFDFYGIKSNDIQTLNNSL